ncbi:MAG: hypothetical protein Q4C48_08870 [Lachnospiraceae bacterium]|nr:hypothetical protein [Lachnospiraceae bacterium]
MTEEEYREKVNPCYGCGCYDEDMGCSMPSCDRIYACSVYATPDDEEDEKIALPPRRRGIFLKDE